MAQAATQLLDRAKFDSFMRVEFGHETFGEMMEAEDWADTRVAVFEDLLVEG